MKVQYEGEEPCCRCIHKKVCSARECLNEIQYSTTHPYFDIEVKCTEFYNEQLATMAERQLINESDNYEENIYKSTDERINRFANLY